MNFLWMLGVLAIVSFVGALIICIIMSMKRLSKSWARRQDSRPAAAFIVLMVLFVASLVTFCVWFIYDPHVDVVASETVVHDIVNVQEDSRDSSDLIIVTYINEVTAEELPIVLSQNDIPEGQSLQSISKLTETIFPEAPDTFFKKGSPEKTNWGLS